MQTQIKDLLLLDEEDKKHFVFQSFFLILVFVVNTTSIP